MSKTSPRLPILLATAGFLLSIWLEVEHVRSHLHPAADSYCRVDAFFDCVRVALSPYSRVLGIPLPIWGAVGFGAILVSAIRRSKLFIWLTAFSALASVVLFIQEIAYIGSICLLCGAVHIICLALLVAAGYQYRNNALQARLGIKDLLIEIGIPSALLLLCYGFIPPYWALVSWTNELQIPHGVDEQGHPWIGAERPIVTIHEYTDYACPYCAIAASRSRLRVMKHADRLRLVRHQQPRMFCPNIGGVHCQYVRAALCAAEQNKFWQMDDWLFQHVPGNLYIDYKQAALDVGIDSDRLKRCMADDATYRKADRESKAARKAGINYAPMYIVNGERLSSTQLEIELQKQLEK